MGKRPVIYKVFSKKFSLSQSGGFTLIRKRQLKLANLSGIFGSVLNHHERILKAYISPGKRQSFIFNYLHSGDHVFLNLMPSFTEEKKHKG